MIIDHLIEKNMVANPLISFSYITTEGVTSIIVFLVIICILLIVLIRMLIKREKTRKSALKKANDSLIQTNNLLRQKIEEKNIEIEQEIEEIRKTNDEIINVNNLLNLLNLMREYSKNLMEQLGAIKNSYLNSDQIYKKYLSKVEESTEEDFHVLTDKIKRGSNEIEMALDNYKMYSNFHQKIIRELHKLAIEQLNICTIIKKYIVAPIESKSNEVFIETYGNILKMFFDEVSEIVDYKKIEQVKLKEEGEEILVEVYIDSSAKIDEYVLFLLDSIAKYLLNGTLSDTQIIDKEVIIIRLPKKLT